MKANCKAFSLLEILLALTILLGLLSVLIYNFSSLSDSQNYYEAKNNLKTYIIYQKNKAALTQKDIKIEFDSQGNVFVDGDEQYLNLFTNDLKILETSATKIVFFSDGGVEESYIITSSLDNKITNRIIINVLGNILENSDFSASGSPEEQP